MIAASQQYRTRVVRSHEPWIPLPYMERAVNHLLERSAAALWLDPGLGKTAVTLEAFRQLKEMGVVDKMLVIAPLRVCQLVWEQEGRKWTQFRNLTFSLIHGRKKEDALRADVDIHLINPEGIAWLAEQYWGRTDIPWDVVTADELTKFKNARAARSKKLRKLIRRARFRWGLTGTPTPNGYMDLFGQFLLLDDGAALGRYITYFRDQYFRQGFNGFDWELKPGGSERIEQRIAPYVLRMSAKDYLDLPQLIDNPIHVTLPAKARLQYEEMKKETLLSLPEGVITAANAGAVYSKLAQMANGAVYIRENEYVEIHDAKLDALEDLIEELAGQPLLVGYEFQHDLDRLRNRLGQDTPTLTGLSHKRIVEVEAAWNNGERPVLLAHPASAGHGLNLQGFGAGHLCWFSKPWDLELYDQFIRRLLRQGTTAQRIMNHALIVKDSMDEVKEEALGEKDTTQQHLFNALNAVFAGSTTTHNREDDDMVRKLGFRGAENSGGSAAAAAPAQQSARVQPRGWGPQPVADDQQEEEQQEEKAQAPTRPQRPQRPAAQQEEKPRPVGWGPPAEPDAQREAITDKIQAPAESQGDLPLDDEDDDGPPPSARALAAFAGAGVQGLEGGEDPDGDAEPPKEEKPKRTRRGTATPAPATTARNSAADVANASASAALGGAADPEVLATLFETIATLLRSGK